jgi:hypothetical protein
MSDDDYETFIRKVGTGATLSEAEWLFHFDHQNGDARDGIARGEAAPEFALPDQHGRLRTRADLTGEHALLLTFVRSADW